MLYVGAHVDVYPLTCGELRKAYRRFVYVDGTPQSKYWEPYDCPGRRNSVSELVMMECMQNKGGEYAGMSDFTQQPCGGYLAALADDSSVIYYFNSPDCLGVPRDVLDSVTALYIHGHAPDVSVVDKIRSVTRVYASPLCVGCAAYVAVCKKTGLDGSTKNPCPPIIDEVYWDVECDEFVVNNRGCSPRLESDAPVRYECTSDSSEEWETESTDAETGDSPAGD